jgi:hypothetical protein
MKFAAILIPVVLSSQSEIETVSTLRRICTEMERSPLEFAKLGNSQLYYFSGNPSRDTLAEAAVFADVDVLCGDMSRYPDFLRQTVLRQKVIRHHLDESMVYRRSPIKLGGILTDIMKYSVPDLLMGDPTIGAQLTHLVKTVIFDGSHIHRGLSPIEHANGLFTLATESRCIHEDFVALGRVLALAVVFNAPTGKVLNTALFDVLLGKRQGWTMRDLEFDVPRRFYQVAHAMRAFNREPSQRDIDFALYGFSREAYDLVSQGFNEIVPVDLAKGLLSAKDLMRTIEGEDSPNTSEFQAYLSNLPNSNSPAFRAFRTYADSNWRIESIMKFITGSDIVPVGGFRIMTPPVKVEVVKRGKTITADLGSRTLYIPSRLSADEIVKQLSAIFRGS